ncbi:right-handed parallel beta-helix repeat-containing protein [Plantibacter sp. VKM Ac-2880]|uniref:right-handed parallel beta-helix repeat-containing protein n=1 Tax=Plantibacter sp. VKM Ac-2880 TaxID=2783827 RepID=UPI00188E4F58|nr:right-handed parallel beta-helix repeat-containing protein [Plantibacter sp. VKM Ac-2880]MBF4568772.1 right-handed parallel beta-helix repeat-containing protein [Plantibacter sp. VKM Ac-2880]
MPESVLDALPFSPSTIEDGTVVGDNLVLTKLDGSTKVAGNVRGPAGADGANVLPTQQAIAEAVAAGVADTRYAKLPTPQKNALTGWFHADGFAGATGDLKVKAAVIAAAGIAPVYISGALAFATAVPLLSGTHLIGNPNAVIDMGSLASAFTAPGISDVLIEGLKFAGTTSTSVVLLATAAASNITMRRNVLQGPRLLSTNPGVTYANGTAAICTDITITDNQCTGIVGGPDLACVLIPYTRRVTITNNRISLYRHGVQFWGGNSNPANDGVVVNARKCGDLVITGNLVYDIGMGGIWGSMGENVTIEGNTVRTCGDVCIDVEGCWNVSIAGNTAKDGFNGCITVFFYNRDVSITGNTVVQTNAGRLTVGIYNSGDNTQNKGITISGNAISGVGVMAQFGHDGASDITVVGNTFRNVYIKWDATNFRILNISNNTLTYDIVAAEAFTAIELARPRGGARTAPQIARGNVISSLANQPAGSVGIHAISDSFNDDNLQQILGNNIGGFPIDIQVTQNSANTGRTQNFQVEDNVLGTATPGIVRNDTGTGKSTLRTRGNLRHNGNPWPEAIPTDTTLAWDAGTRIEYRAPAAGGFTGAVCTTAGSPGVWKQFGSIAA